MHRPPAPLLSPTAPLHGGRSVSRATRAKSEILGDPDAPVVDAHCSTYDGEEERGPYPPGRADLPAGIGRHSRNEPGDDFAVHRASPIVSAEKTKCEVSAFRA